MHKASETKTDWPRKILLGAVSGLQTVHTHPGILSKCQLCVILFLWLGVQKEQCRVYCIMLCVSLDTQEKTRKKMCLQICFLHSSQKIWLVLLCHNSGANPRHLSLEKVLVDTRKSLLSQENVWDVTKHNWADHNQKQQIPTEGQSSPFHFTN